MKIMLQKGDYLWSIDGTHICDETGLALKAENVTEVEIEDRHLDRVVPIIRQTRRSEGLIVDFGLAQLWDYTK